MNRAPVPAVPPVAALLAALLVLACNVALPSPSSAPPDGASGVPVSATATFDAPSTFGPPPSPTEPDDTSPVTLDPELLAVLPESIDGVPVQEDLDVATEALLDPNLSDIASAVDAAVAVDTGSGNLVTAWVVQLRPSRFGDEAFRQWRDSYDEGACSAAGGVVGNAEAEIGGRTTYITSCVAALRTYHVWLEEESLLVSASAIGDGRFGEKLMEGLRPPGAEASE
ncbi:MAG TPA: hypothetical protein VNL94_03545 [Candidatus Binatia bacterium]|nr:hypothetical protein [Candidatus Binatia bacterium]